MTATPPRNWYTVLGVATDVTPQELRTRYRALRALYEDDVSTYGLFDDTARRAALEEIEAAFGVLGEPDRRSAYDSDLRASGVSGPWYEEPLLRAPVPPTPGEDTVAGPSAALVGSDGGELSRTPHVLDPQQARLQLDPPAGRIDGAYLRYAREIRGVTLDALSRAIKITVTQLENIEMERYDRLPAPVYLRGFLRAYARFVGLDSEQVVSDYMKRHAAWESGKRT